MKTRILVVDDHDVVRRGVISIVSGRPDWVVCGECRSGREAVAAAAELKPDIVIMDVSMRDMNGLDATRQIIKENPKSQILVLTMHDSEDLIRQVFAAGARGYLLKNEASAELGPAIEAIRRGRPYFTATVAEAMLRRYVENPGAQDTRYELDGSLTAREREIVQLVAEGKSSKEIATILNITAKTVETHRANIMNKLELRSIPDLVRYAIRNHIIEC
jgi:DNA-binding NarL/FixJ family response regulator